MGDHRTLHRPFIVCHLLQVARSVTFCSKQRCPIAFKTRVSKVRLGLRCPLSLMLIIGREHSDIFANAFLDSPRAVRSSLNASPAIGTISTFVSRPLESRRLSR